MRQNGSARLLPLDHPDVIPEAFAALLTRVFGGRDDTMALIAGWLKDDSRRALLALTDEGDCIGAMIVRLQTSEQLADGYGAPFGLDLAALHPNTLMGAFQMLAVAPEWRQRGVASALAADQLAWLVAQRATMGVGISWDHGGFGGAGSSKHMFESAGFEAVASSRTFYQAMHAQSGQTCPRCQPKPCDCNAILFVARSLGGRR